jgi:hypothetical protein
MKFYKKILVDAFRFGFNSIPDWFVDDVEKGHIIIKHPGKSNYYCLVKTEWGPTKCEPGDHVVKNTDGELSVVSHDAFNQHFDLAQ